MQTGYSVVFIVDVTNLGVICIVHVLVLLEGRCGLHLPDEICRGFMIQRKLRKVWVDGILRAVRFSGVRNAMGDLVKSYKAAIYHPGHVRP